MFGNESVIGSEIFVSVDDNSVILLPLEGNLQTNTIYPTTQ